MNIIEALNLAKEQGIKVRPVCAEWFVEFDEDLNSYIKKIKDSDAISVTLTIDNTLKKWEVVEESTDKSEIKKIEELIDKKIEIAKKEIYEKVDKWINEMW